MAGTPEPLAVIDELAALGRALTGAIRTETIASHAADAIVRLLDPAGLLIVMERDSTGDVATTFARGAPVAVPVDAFLRECLSGEVVRRRSDPTRLGVPFVAAGHALGCAIVEGPATDDALAERALAAVAAQVAIALQNARLLNLLSSGKREWEQMVDGIASAVCIMDARGTVRRGNRALAALVGTEVTTLPGRPWQSLLPAAWVQPLERLLASSERTEAVELRDGGRAFSVSASHMAAERPDDAVAVLVLEDHTERHRLQEQLIQSEKMSAIGQLIAGVAHELNNPLASVLGFADFLSESGRVPAEIAEPVRVIQQEAQRAASIVKNLLTFARRQDQERRPVAVGEILERTVALLRNQLISHRVEPALVVEPHLPEVFGSPNQIQQVFLNLINNAAQAIASAGRPGTVTVRARPWLDGVAVEVADNGPGVPPHVRDHVFEPFFTTKREGEGTGLGLSICLGIVKEHGGRISLAETPGGGATFLVELPAAPSQEAAPQAEEPAAAAPARVLVVDDEPHIRYYMRSTLEALGHVVDLADDGARGLELALTGPYDVVFTDVRMPGLGGREFYEQLERQAPAVAERVVFATGDTVAEETVEFLAGTGRPVLHKPFKLAELRSTLAALLKDR